MHIDVSSIDNELNTLEKDADSAIIFYRIIASLKSSKKNFVIPLAQKPIIKDALKK